MRLQSMGWTAILVAGCASGYGGGDASNHDFPGAGADAATSSGGSDSSEGLTDFTVNVVVGGAGTGTVVSSPGGLTCSGASCSGTFPAGTSVTIEAMAAPGSALGGFGGACSGAGPCVVSNNATVMVEFNTIVGSWRGTYTCVRQNVGCTFNNEGNLSMTITSSGSGYSAAASIDGLELRYVSGCSICCNDASSSTSAPVTLSGNTLSGTHDFYVAEASSNLAFPWTATVNGTTITGMWTCATCTGSFTLTRQ